MLNSLSAETPESAEAEQLVNARPIWLCVVQFLSFVVRRQSQDPN
jgi:hypothetical protein